MSERFNFYDVYGYLIPGFVLLGLIWLPIRIVTGEAPSLDFGDALSGLLGAYVLGHVLSTVTALAFPSGRRIAPGDIRRPSDDLLDRSASSSPASYISKLEERIKEAFGLDLADQTLQPSDVVELRRTAFLLCRDRLVLSGKGRYAEQFEGMYTMMRGISGASVLAAYYLLGWIVGSICAGPKQSSAALPWWLACVGAIFVGFDFWLNRSARSGKKSKVPSAPAESPSATAPAAATSRTVRVVRWARRHWATAVFWSLVSLAAYAGLRLGQAATWLGDRRSLVIAAAVGTVFLAGRCYASYEYFAKIFAETVYRNFLALPDARASAVNA